MPLKNLWRHPFRVPPIKKPRAEGRFHLTGRRRLGYAEYGDPSGPVVWWFHGTPGGRRQFPLLGRRAADNLGLRVVAVERPGSGRPIRTLMTRWSIWPPMWPRWRTPWVPDGWRTGLSGGGRLLRRAPRRPRLRIE